MTRLKALLISLLVALPLFGWVAVAHAQSFRSGSEITVSSGQVVNSSLYASGNTIDIAGVVNGDIYCAGQNVVVSGTVDGDVICAGQNVTVSGTVRGSVRLAGQTVTVSGRVTGSASLAGQTVTVPSKGSIGRDVGIMASTTTLSGEVGRDVAFAGEGLTVSGTVGRNVQARLDQLTLADGAQVGGNVAYTSANKVQQAASAQVAGTVVQTQPPVSSPVWAVSFIAGLWLFIIYLFFALLLVALVLVLVWPQVFHQATGYARRHMGKTFLVGLVASIVVPAVLLVLVFTVIGIPLALFAGLVWVLVTLLAWPFAGYLLGRLVLRRSTNAIVIMLTGTALLLVISLIPFVGPLVALVGFWFGLGTLILRLVHGERPYYRVAADTDDMAVATSQPEPVAEPATRPAVRKKSAKNQAKK